MSLEQISPIAFADYGFASLDKLNYQQAAIQLIRLIRGSISQRDLSQKLGYTFNQVGKWEAGLTQIKWSQFVTLCQILEIPFEQNFKYIFYNNHKPFSISASIQSILDFTNMSSKPDSKARTTYKKWLDGKTVPDLAEIIQLLSVHPPSLFSWLSSLVDCRNISVFARPYEFYLKNVEIVMHYPLATYVNAALKVKAYQDLSEHNDAVLAEHATCTVSELKKILQILVGTGLVHFDGKKYHAGIFNFKFAGIRNEKLRSLTKYTTQLTAERYSTTPLQSAGEAPNVIRQYNPSQSSVRVAAMSSEAAQKVVELVLKFHHQVEEVLKQDVGAKDNVQVILLHSFASNINAPRNN